MDKKFLFLIKITTSSTGSFEISKEFLNKWLKKEKKFQIHVFMVLFLKIFFFEQAFFIKEKIFFFFSFFLISQTRFSSSYVKNFLAFTIFFLIKNLESIRVRCDMDKFNFFRIFFYNIPTGASLKPSFLKSLLSFLTKDIFCKKKSGENFPFPFLFRFFQSGVEKDVVTNFFFKFISEKFFYSKRKQFIGIAKINRFLMGAILRDIKRSNFIFAKGWKNHVVNLKFETLSEKQISKLNLLNRKKNQNRKFFEKFLQFEFQKKKKLRMYSKNFRKNILEKKEPKFSSCSKNRVNPEIFPKKKKKERFLDYVKGGMALVLIKRGKNIEKILIGKKIKEKVHFLFLEKKITKKKKKSNKIFLKPKIKNCFFFLKNFFIEITSDSFFRKKKNGENFSNWSFRYSIVSIWILVRLKALTTIFLIEKGRFLIFKEFFSKYIRNSSNISDQCLIFEFLKWNQNLFWGKITRFTKISNYLLLNFNSDFFQKKFKIGSSSLLLFLKKSLSNLSGIEINLHSNNFRGSKNGMIFFFNDFLFSGIIGREKNLNLTGEMEKQRIIPLKVLNQNFFAKLSLFFLGWKTKKFFLKQLIGFLFFQLSDKNLKNNSGRRFLKWIEANWNLMKRKEKKRNFLEKTTGWIFNSQILFWFRLILSYWCDFFWCKSYFFFFFLIKKVLLNSFLFYKKNQEKIFLKTIRNWISNAAFFKKHFIFLKKRNCILNKKFNFKVLFHLQRFL